MLSLTTINVFRVMQPAFFRRPVEKSNSRLFRSTKSGEQTHQSVKAGAGRKIYTR